jgi:hypothetical protein
MTPYDGPERRSNDGPVLKAIADMRVEMADRLGRMEENQKGANARLLNHSERIEALCDRAKSLESSRDNVKGAMWVIGAPTLGGLAYLFYEVGNLIKYVSKGMR